MASRSVQGLDGGAGADRVVDHVDAVVDRLLDGGEDRVALAAAVADVVADDVGVRRDTLDGRGHRELVLGALRRVRRRLDLVAGRRCCRCGCRGRRRRRRRRRSAAGLRVLEVVVADQLVVAAPARRRTGPRWRSRTAEVVAGAERVDVVVAVAAVGLRDAVRERRVGRVEPESRMPTTTPSPLLPTPPGTLVPSHTVGCADPLGALVRRSARARSRPGPRDAGDAGDLLRLGAGHPHGDAVEGLACSGSSAVTSPVVTRDDRVDQVGLLLLQLAAVARLGPGRGHATLDRDLRRGTAGACSCAK